MKIGFLGTGQVASSLGSLCRNAGYEVMLGARQVPVKAADHPHTIGTLTDAAAFGEMVMVAIPFTACEEVLPPLAPLLKDKIVVDITNPLKPGWRPLPLPDSAGEQISRWLPGAHVVKAFNTVFADLMQPGLLDLEGRKVTAFICSDHRQSGERVSQLAAQLGFAPVVTGSLACSAYTEAMAHLNIHLAVAMKGGTNAGFIYFQR